MLSNNLIWDKGSFDILEVDSWGSMTSEWTQSSENLINLLFIFNFLFDQIFLKV